MFHDNIENYDKGFVFDIDGTLVSFSTHRVPDSAVKALAKAREKGVKIFISTGRPRQFINNLGQIEHLIDGYITTNGAYCFIGERQVRLFPIPPHDVAEMMEKSDEKGFGCLVIGLHGAAVHNRTKEMDHIIVDMLNLDYMNIVEPIDEVLLQPVLQITPFFDRPTEEEVMRSLPGCRSVRWYPDFSDVTSVAADKGSAIADMAAAEGIDISETMAFGDGGNDLSMLRRAGVGVAMGNAIDSVKAGADYVTASVDDDGVARALELYL